MMERDKEKMALSSLFKQTKTRTLCEQKRPDSSLVVGTGCCSSAASLSCLMGNKFHSIWLQSTMCPDGVQFWPMLYFLSLLQITEHNSRAWKTPLLTSPYWAPRISHRERYHRAPISPTAPPQVSSVAGAGRRRHHLSADPETPQLAHPFP